MNETVTNDQISGDTVFTVVPDKQEVRITRVFDAPRELVFEAYVDAEQIPLWWGPRDLETIVDQLDPRPGGGWRFLNRRAGEPTEHGFHGFYHEVTRPERLVYTFEYEGVPGHVLMETVTLEDLDGKTRATSSAVYQSMADRDGMVAAGMESGSRQGLDRLAELLAAKQR
jgi:uncharacterized protein YndB with AHSA1/START domain